MKVNHLATWLLQRKMNIDENKQQVLLITKSHIWNDHKRKDQAQNGKPATKGVVNHFFPRLRVLF